MADEHQSDRATLRAAMRAARRSLPVAVRVANATAVSSRALDLLARLDRDDDRRPLAIAATVADDGELDPGPLVDALRARGARIAYPRVRNGQMTFAFAESTETFVAGPGRVLQPDDAAEAAQVAPASLDVVLVPVVAFDAHCNRIGRGGGHYDRAFARRREASPLLIGLAHDDQLVADAAPEAHDVALDHVVTPGGAFSRLGA